MPRQMPPPANHQARAAISSAPPGGNVLPSTPTTVTAMCHASQAPAHDNHHRYLPTLPAADHPALTVIAIAVPP